MENSSQRKRFLEQVDAPDDVKVEVAEAAAERLEAALAADWEADILPGHPRACALLGGSPNYVVRLTVECLPFGWSARMRTCNGRSCQTGEHAQPEEALEALFEEAPYVLQQLAEDVVDVTEQIELHRSLWVDAREETS